MRSVRFLSPVLVSISLVAAACSGGGGTDSTSDVVDTAPVGSDADATDTTDAVVTDPPEADETTTTIAPPATTIAPAPIEGPLAVVQLLAVDGLAGRDNLTNGSATTRGLLIPMLREYAQPFRPELDGDSGFLLQYEEGVNLLAVMPGRGELADEYVVIGAHYDHLGRGPDACDQLDTVDDVICNGAADNAAGVAMVLAVAASIRDADEAALVDAGDAGDAGRRSVIVALWDGGEDERAGSQFFVDNPPFRLADIAAYINFDIQGASLLPSLSASSMVIGAETGGLLLAVATQEAIDQSALDYAHISLVFDEGRSDNEQFARAGVPAVSFTDAPNGCNHTVLDDLAHIDGDKLLLQIDTASALVVDLATRTARPQFLEGAPVTRYSDAEEWLELVERAEPDFGLLGPESASDATQLLEDLRSIVDDGVGAYGNGDEATMLDGVASLFNAFASTECVVPA